MIRGMQNLLKDPIVLVCIAVLLFGFIALLWAIARVLPKKKKSSDFMSDPLLSESPVDGGERGGDDLLLQDPLAPVRPETSRLSMAAGANTNVGERLEQMAQRLAEMQTVLSKQAAPVGAGGTAPMGQGFSPETLDKLLKIIGNVTQQVEILQKALHVKDAPKA